MIKTPILVLIGLRNNFFGQNLVIKTKSVEYMPFYLSLATFLMSLSFFAYGMFKNDPFISVSNISILQADSFSFSSFPVLLKSTDVLLKFCCMFKIILIVSGDKSKEVWTSKFFLHHLFMKDENLF